MNTALNTALQQGLNALKVGAYSQAIDYFQIVIQANRHFDQAWYSLIQTYLFNDQIDKALDYAERAYGEFPNHPRLAHLYATCLQQAKCLEQAIDVYRQALAWRVTQPPLTAKTGQPPPFNQVENERLLWQTLAQLANAGVYAFATSGTLLGLVREKRLLPFDKDIDIGLPFEQMRAAIRCIETFGWQEVHRSYGLINPRCFRHPNGLILDLCGYGTDLDTGEVISGMWMDQVPMSWNRVTRYPVPILKKQARAEGVVWCLKQPEDYLNALYGEWQRPDPDFDTVICAHNLKEFSVLTQCFAFSRLFSLWHQGKLAKCQRLLQCCLHHRPHDTLLLNLQDKLRTDAPS
ncbi:MAG: tetratricopeptide repeat protein [Thiomicrospira sp.]